MTVASDPARVTGTLAAFAAGTSAEELPDETRRATRRLVLDTLGCAVGGRCVPSSRIVADVKLASGGHEQATVVVTGERTSLPTACYVNSHFANALDAEETILHSGHVAASVVPPALAVAEHLDSTGRDFLAAVAVGFDVAARIGLSCRQLDVSADGTVEVAPVGGLSWAAFGAAVAAGRLLGLTADEMQHAFGITAATTPMPIGGRWGTIRSPRPMTKYGMFGAMSEAGVTAAFLARAGFEGDRAVLDGDRGFWRMMGSTRCDWSVLTDRLGDRFLGDETSYKLFPACHWAMPALDVFDRLCRDNALSPADIDQVDVQVPEGAINKYMDAPEVATVVDGQFSIPHLIALTAVRRDSAPAWHTPAAIADRQLHEFARRVVVRTNQAARDVMHAKLLAHGHCEIIPTVVTVRAGGRSWTAAADHAMGDAWAPGATASDHVLRAKFRRFCAEQLPAGQIDDVIQLVDSVSMLESVRPLVLALVARR